MNSLNAKKHIATMNPTLESHKNANAVKTMKTTLRMKCFYCGHWNRVPANKIFIEQNTSDSKVKAYIRVYEPLEVVKCKTCGKVIAEQKELIRIVKSAIKEECS